MRARSQLANCFADAGFQVKVEVFFFTKIVFDAMTEFQFPGLGSVEVPNLLKPGIMAVTGSRKFIQTVIL